MKTPPSKPAADPSKEAPAPKIRHEGGRAVWQWAADTARHVALSTSQVLRKLDNSSLSIEDTAAPRGKPSSRKNAPLPGGGINPYEARPVVRGRTREAHRTASPTKPRSPVPARARASWWSRLFRRG